MFEYIFNLYTCIFLHITNVWHRRYVLYCPWIGCIFVALISHIFTCAHACIFLCAFMFVCFALVCVRVIASVCVHVCACMRA